MFEASKKEVLKDQTTEKVLKDLAMIRLRQTIAKHNIAHTALWAKQTASRSREQKKDAFADKLEQIAIDLTDAYTAFAEIEMENVALRSRTADLEMKILQYQSTIMRLNTIIANYEKELFT